MGLLSALGLGVDAVDELLEQGGFLMDPRFIEPPEILLGPKQLQVEPHGGGSFEQRRQQIVRQYAGKEGGIGVIFGIFPDDPGQQPLGADRILFMDAAEQRLLLVGAVKQPAADVGKGVEEDKPGLLPEAAAIEGFNRLRVGGGELLLPLDGTAAGHDMLRQLGEEFPRCFLGGFLRGKIEDERQVFVIIVRRVDGIIRIGVGERGGEQRAEHILHQLRLPSRVERDCQNGELWIGENDPIGLAVLFGGLGGGRAQQPAQIGAAQGGELFIHLLVELGVVVHQLAEQRTDALKFGIRGIIGRHAVVVDELHDVADWLIVALAHQVGGQHAQQED